MEPDTSTDETTEAPTETDAWLDACPPGETRSVTIGDITYTRTVERHDANDKAAESRLTEVLESFIVRWNKAMDA